jgi:fibronectin-binding autotransporter adhesin
VAFFRRVHRASGVRSSPKIRQVVLGTTALSGIALAMAIAASDRVEADDYIWGGAGSTTTTNNWNTGTNWGAVAPALQGNAPPNTATEGAFFDGANALASTAVTVTAPVTVNELVFSGARAYSIDGSTITLAGTTARVSGGSNVGVIETVSNVIAGSAGAATTQVQVVNGTLVFRGANTYTGTTFVQSGTFGLAGSGSVANSVVQFGGAGASFDISGVTTGSTTIGGLQGAFNPPVSVTLGANTLNIGNVNGLNFFSGNISGTGGVTLMGGGPTAFGNVNDYTGETTVTNGTRFILSIHSRTRGASPLRAG